MNKLCNYVQPANKTQFLVQPTSLDCFRPSLMSFINVKVIVQLNKFKIYQSWCLIKLKRLLF